MLTRAARVRSLTRAVPGIFVAILHGHLPVAEELHPNEFIDLEAIQGWLQPGSPLEERERAGLFRIAALGAWARHHGVVGATSEASC